MRYASARFGGVHVVLTLVTALAVGGAPAVTTALTGPDDLDTLFDRLERCHSPAEASLLEDRIYERWSRSGDAAVDSLLGAGVVRMARGDYDAAIALFDRAVARAPRFAEGFNKRATAHYLRGDYAASLADVDRTLALEPRHFGALAGRGMIALVQGNAREALKAFERVLALNPSSPAARAQVDALQVRLGYRRV